MASYEIRKYKQGRFTAALYYMVDEWPHEHLVTKCVSQKEANLILAVLTQPDPDNVRALLQLTRKYDLKLGLPPSAAIDKVVHYTRGVARLPWLAGVIAEFDASAS